MNLDRFARPARCVGYASVVSVLALVFVACEGQDKMQPKVPETTSAEAHGTKTDETGSPARSQRTPSRSRTRWAPAPTKALNPCRSPTCRAVP